MKRVDRWPARAFGVVHLIVAVSDATTKISPHSCGWPRGRASGRTRSFPPSGLAAWARCIGRGIPSSIATSPSRSFPRRSLLTPNASPELLDLLPEFRRREVRQVHSHHDSGRRAEPSTRGRAWDPEIGRDGQVSGALDEIPEPMVCGVERDNRQVTSCRVNRHLPRRQVAYVKS